MGSFFAMQLYKPKLKLLKFATVLNLLPDVLEGYQLMVPMKVAVFSRKLQHIAAITKERLEGVLYLTKNS